jgi:anti-sigma regulatory factor (Ser/Thr protein kinase)
VFWSSTTTRSRSIVVRAFVGPRPVLSAIRRTIAWEIAPYSAPPSGRSCGESWLAAMAGLRFSSPGAARIVAASYLRDRVTAPVLDTALLLVSELVTNSVRHSHAPSAEGVMVRLQLTRAMLRLEVEDSGHDGAIAAQPPDHQNGGGFGLNIVQTLSDRWGVERSAHSGTRVWAQLPRTPLTAPPS